MEYNSDKEWRHQTMIEIQHRDITRQKNTNKQYEKTQELKLLPRQDITFTNVCSQGQKKKIAFRGIKTCTSDLA